MQWSAWRNTSGNESSIKYRKYLINGDTLSDYIEITVVENIFQLIFSSKLQYLCNTFNQLHKDEDFIFSNLNEGMNFIDVFLNKISGLEAFI